jgi:hypothetical protein
VIAIVFLIVSVLCDSFKSLRRLEADHHGAEAGSAIAELEDFPSQSRGGDCVD